MSIVTGERVERQDAEYKTNEDKNPSLIEKVQAVKEYSGEVLLMHHSVSSTYVPVINVQFSQDAIIKGISITTSQSDVGSFIVESWFSSKTASSSPGGSKSIAVGSNTPGVCTTFIPLPNIRIKKDSYWHINIGEGGAPLGYIVCSLIGYYS